jgi:hypothetical protein
MPLKNSIRSKKSPRVNPLTRMKKHTRLAGRFGAGSIALAVIVGVIAAAMLIGAHQASPPAHIASVDTASADTQPEKLAKPAGAKKAAAATAPVAGGVPAETPAANATAANVHPVESAAKASVPAPAPVTITGCLERADETFRLKDTTGVDAPKSRSWKSVFLKKSSASIEVVDAANRLKLPDHVGQRVSVTGTLVDREMQVRSLQRVAASCTNSPREGI